MPVSSSGRNPDLAKLVEKQLRNWELARAVQSKSAASAGDANKVYEFVTASRAVASGGTQVTTLLGERLNWPVFDRAILQAMAGDDTVRERLYKGLDERDVSWLESALRWIMRSELRNDDYFYRLSETALTLVRQGPAVFLGRGIDQLLPREQGLRVRVTASAERRAAEFARRNNMSPALAHAEIERIDRERAEYRRAHFGRYANDEACYDLILGMDRLTVDQAVETILVLLRLKGMAA